LLRLAICSADDVRDKRVADTHLLQFCCAPRDRRAEVLTEPAELPVLSEITIATGATRTVPLRFASSPTGNYVDVDRVWFDHYFAWEPDAAGALRVTARANADVMPHRGTLVEKPSSREYHVNDAKVELHEALIACGWSSLSAQVPRA
jgi:hypothetical protein